MHNLVRRFMSGASLAVLAFGAIPAATARATTISFGTTSHVTIPTGHVEDYILVTNDGTVTGNITNNGIVGVPAHDFGIEVHSSSVLEPAVVGVGHSTHGNIVNNNIILAIGDSSANGVLIAGPDAYLHGNISNNFNADIVVVATSANTEVAGIATRSHAHFTGQIFNTGEIHVGGTGDTEFEGIAREGHNVGANGLVTDFNYDHGLIAIAANNHSSVVTAIGYEAEVSGDIGLKFVNDGVVSAQARVTGFANGTAVAYGVHISNTSFHSFNHNETGEVVNYGEVIAGAVATETAIGDHATATAGGVEIKVFGTGGTDNTVKATARNHNFIDAYANAGAQTTAAQPIFRAYHASANAFGVELVASEGHHALASMTNNGLILVLATAAAHWTAKAHATGVNEKVSHAHSGTDIAVNSDEIDVEARAHAGFTAKATATGIKQFASHVTGKALEKVTNTGLVTVHAYATGTVPTAKAFGVVQTESHVAAFTNSVLNKKGATIKVYASAVDADGVAVATASAVGQSARGTLGDPKNKVTNYGHMTGTAVAHGHFAATANTRPVHEKLVGFATATNSVYNDGHIVAHAHATANAGVANAHATAVYQHLTTVGTGKNTVNNYFKITANAVATGHTHARATAFGAWQSINGANTAHNFLSNHGLNGTILTEHHGSIRAIAHASGKTATQVAASGIDQTAHQVHVGIAKNDVENYGDVYARATAVAHTGRAHGYANAVFQSFSHVKTGTQTFHAQHSGFVTASAKANGPNQATATAVGGRQEAHHVTKNVDWATAHGDVKAIAHATAATAATHGALAKAYGFHQTATHVNTASVHAYVSQDGFIDVTAKAHAKSAHAAATAAGFFQSGKLIIKGFNYVSVSEFGRDLAKATVTAGRGVAKAYGAQQIGVSNNHWHNTAIETRHGLVTAQANVHAQTNFGDATAYGFNQHIQGFITAATAHNKVTNNGHVFATASAHAKHNANARASGVHQDIQTAVTGKDFLFNKGTAAGIHANATANGSVADAFADGVVQVALAHDAFNTAHNSGLIHAHASAVASHSGAGVVAKDVVQDADLVGGIAVNHYTNNGFVTATGKAHATHFAHVSAFGNSQVAFGSGTGATAKHAAALNIASNLADGFMQVHATAKAAKATGVSAIADARAVGIFQSAHAAGTKVARDYALNDHHILVSAKATATAKTVAHAHATAAGIAQHINAPTGVGYATMSNNNDITAEARAHANGAGAQDATAIAGGAVAWGNSPKLHADLVNSGNVVAAAYAFGAHPKATAVALGARNSAVGGVIDKTIENFDVVDATAEAAGGHAFAVGEGAEAPKFIGEILNTGDVFAFALGKTATAVGMGVISFGVPVGTGTGLVVNNGGFVRGDANFAAGFAIDVNGAPNKVNVLLEGVGRTGTVVGNIGIAAPDTITVENGKTFFEGTVNPAPIGKVGTLTLAGNGTLDLADIPTSFWGANAVVNVNQYNQPGTLELEVDAAGDNGVINANGANLTGGTVLVNPAIGLYANTTVYKVVFAPLGGTTWNNPILSTTVTPLLTFSAAYPSASEADIVITRVPFDAVPGLTPNEEAVGDGLEHAYSTSYVGDAALFYESLFQFNLANYRGALDELSGEEAGEMALINVNAARDFIDTISVHLGALGSMSGQASIASINSLASNAQPVGLGTNPSAGGAMGAMGSIPSTTNSGSTVAYMNGNTDTRVWGSGFGSWTNTNTTISGPGYTTNHAGLAVGLDMQIDPSLLVGIAGDYSGGAAVNFRAMPNSPTGVPAHGSDSGFQVGLYGRYDNWMGFYIDGSASFGTYNDKTLRFVSLPLLGSGFLAGKFTSDVWAADAEAGYPLDMGGGATFTPYVGFAYIGSDSGAYTETGTIGSGHTVANLVVSDAAAKSFASYLGAEVSTAWHLSDETTVYPSLKLAWQHEFGSNIWQVNASFLGIGPSSGFTVTGAALAKDSGVADAAISVGLMDNLSATFGYEGRFSQTEIDNFVIGRLDLHM